MLMQLIQPTLSAAVDSLVYALPALPGFESVASFLSGFELRLLVIPPITGIIGYITNWVGIRLMFNPINFRGFKIPGMDQVSEFMPRKIQQIPGVMEGKFGWQGIVPSRAAKMGSIAYDNSVEKVASQREFYRQFDPDVVAQYVVQEGKEDIHALVDDILRTEYPDLWEEAPAAVKRAIHQHTE